MRVTVRTEVCVGAGQCTLAAAAIFDQSAAGTVVLLTEDIQPEHTEAARAAADWCPSGAIEVHDR